jgi:hypothetical protein
MKVDHSLGRRSRCWTLCIVWCGTQPLICRDQVKRRAGRHIRPLLAALNDDSLIVVSVMVCALVTSLARRAIEQDETKPNAERSISMNSTSEELTEYIR